MFRDSRGVVHTVSSPDPLSDLPAEAAAVLARALLVPVHGDLGGGLERCEAVGELLDRWQDAFFAALPAAIDREEEARWAAEAGLDLDQIESEWADDEDDEDEDWDDDWEESPGQLGLDDLDLDALAPAEDGLESALEEEVVLELERALLLLPFRVRLEALVAATNLVEAWSDLLADHEKVAGHLLVTHGTHPGEALADHEALVDLHARLHQGSAGHA